MQRQNVIIVTDKKTEVPECFGNFKKACESKGFPYHSLKAKKFPIILNDYVIHRVKFQ